MKFAQQFSRPGKSLENGDKDKCGNMVKSLDFFFLQSYKKSFISEVFSFWSTVRLHLILKEALFLRFLLITYLITLSLEKEIICLEKSLEKFLKFMKP